MRATLLLCLCSLCLLAAPRARAQEADAETMIRQELTAWMEAFNARDTATVCGIFAPGLRYDVQGLPEQGFDDMCNRLHHSLSVQGIGFHYDLNLKEIIVSGDLGVARLVWTLTISRPGVPDVVTSETGLDVFRRQDDGSWKIIRFISYETGA